MNTSGFHKDADYWNRKTVAYLHDSPDKALTCAGSEEQGRRLAESILDSPPAIDLDILSAANRLAAGMDATLLAMIPKEAAGPSSGTEPPELWLTHPTGSDPPLKISLPPALSLDDIAGAVADTACRDLSDTGPAGAALNKPAEPARRFHYVHHCLRQRLADRNVGQLGALWHRMPADSRIPDHSVWQHCGLVSALVSCMELSEEKRASLLVFSITPVQDFIKRARKLRDFWTGSLVLSWLAFEGIRYIVYRFGSVHILYPSLIGQPMMDRILGEELSLPWLIGHQKRGAAEGVASFPNKFVALIPAGKEEETARAIQDALTRAWQDLGQQTLQLLCSVIGSSDSHLTEQFTDQTMGFWNHRWASAPLLDNRDEKLIKDLLSSEIWSNPLGFSPDPRSTRQDNNGLVMGAERLYPVSHALVQSVLSAGKLRQVDERSAEKGIKCSLHGDLEILHFDTSAGQDRNPSAATDPFWKALRKSWRPGSDFKKTERLSSIALIKRIAYRASKGKAGHPLEPLFREAEGFPSTTEMAMADWLDRVRRNGLHADGGPGDQWRRTLAQAVHELEPESGDESSVIEEIDRQKRAWADQVMKRMKKLGDPLHNSDRYYALLFMDGDHMGKLINGQTISSTWQSVFHPGFAERIHQGAARAAESDTWLQRLQERRIIGPAVHAAISEALGDFALYSVPAIVAAHRGRLIYAGGDDVCAVLPVSEALEAAISIAHRYTQGFLSFPDNHSRDPQIISDSWTPTGGGRLCIHLGQGEGISVSAGILICHHKRPLKAAMERGYEVLKKAKVFGGRNALAIDLDKRAGGSREFIAKWNGAPWGGLRLAPPDLASTKLVQHFLILGERLARRRLSTSLVYRLKEMEAGLVAILKEAPSQLVPYVAKQIERSGQTRDTHGNGAIAEVAGHVAALTARWHAGADEPTLEPEALVVAEFMGNRRVRHRLCKGEQA